MPLPIGSLHTNLAFTEVNIGPFQRHHFAAPEASLTA
jgi:hypothetical protein